MNKNGPRESIARPFAIPASTNINRDDMTLSTTDLIASTISAGDQPLAERLCREQLLDYPDDENLLALLAISLHFQARLADSSEIYATLTHSYPHCAVHWSNYATVLREMGAVADSAAAYARSLLLDPVNAETLLNYGLLQMQLQDFAAARSTLLQAHAQDPHSPRIRIHGARACTACRDSQADVLLKPWRSWHSLDEALQLELASLFITLGEAKSAEVLLLELLRRFPSHQQARIQLATVYERMNRLSDSETLLSGLIIDKSAPDEAVCREIDHQHATLALRRGDVVAAREMLYKTGPRDERDYSHYFALAECCDKSGETVAAMRALSVAHARQNEEMKAVTPYRFAPDAPILPSAVTRVMAAEYAVWPKLQAPDQLQSPVFIVGFPRSGTTLLEQMLDAHPMLQSMDERPFFNILSDQLAEQDVHVPRDLAKLRQVDCDELRKRYVSLVCDKISRNWQAQLVDKNPLNMLWLPFIHRLFPNAKFILAVRHPCDVVLSCYMQNFRSTVLAMACTNLEQVATAYVTAMEYWLHHVEVFKPDVLVSRYEDLIANFPQQTGRIGKFLLLDSAKPMERFDEHARNKGFIGTPSYAQVIQPVNRKGLNRWARYREEFAPALGILAPMLRHWGYADEPGR